MGKGPETKFKEQVFRTLNGFDKIWYEKIQQTSKRGTPDVVGCLDSMFFALELKKSANESPSGAQRLKILRIKAAGGFAELAYPENWEEITEKLYEQSRIYSNRRSGR